MGSSLFHDPIYQNFASQRPIATAAQLTMRWLLNPKEIDDLFRENAELQYEQTLLFSTLSQLMTSVVVGEHKSVNAAYRKMFERLDVSVTAVYEKLKRIEPGTSRALVRYGYEQALAAHRQLPGRPRNDLPGYATRILDGNHLGKTEHRLKETRDLVAGPLPGKSLVVFDPRCEAVCDFVPIEDGYAQELSVLDDVIETLERNQLWIADRNFCTLKFMYAIASARSAFVIRQHGKLHGQEKGKLRRIGKTETAEVFEHQLVLPTHEGNTLTVRRIVARLFQPTRDGSNEVVLLTNLPESDADGLVVSELYRSRWRIEKAFLHLTVDFNCEVKALCYPPAALFCFAIALLAYNGLSIIKAAITASHGREQSQLLSHYYLATEIASTTDGMLVALPAERWASVATLSSERFVKQICRISDSVNMKVYRKSVRGPKTPPPKKRGNKRTVHVSTKRILEKRL